MSLPELDLRWIVQADLATCFQICKLEDDYIAHGEIQITRLDRNGKIKWQFSGADIFVTVTGDDAFRIESDHIRLIDFGNTVYKVDFSGNQL